MPKFIDRTGQRFGRLLVLEEAGRNQLKKVLWKCRCDCNNVVLRTAGDLVTGNSVSCGCYLKERITKHGGWKNASYNTWRAMMRRCYKPHDKDYPRYGGVGVTVCVRWHEYIKFAEDMGEPVGAETLDRINPYDNYEPSNCRWASLPTQARNVRVRKDSKSGYIAVPAARPVPNARPAPPTPAPIAAPVPRAVLAAAAGSIAGMLYLLLH